MALPVPSDGVAGGDGKPNKSWMTFFNKISDYFLKINAIGKTTNPPATDLPTALALLNEIQIKVDALNAATTDTN